MDILTVLDKINSNESIKANEFAYVLHKGYASYGRSGLLLTTYGRQVLSTLARAA